MRQARLFTDITRSIRGGESVESRSLRKAGPDESTDLSRARCEVCGVELTARARNGGTEPTGRPPRYCSTACRQRAYRRRVARPQPGAVSPSQEAVDQRDEGPISTALSLPIDSFIGRARELADIGRLLAARRLVTLTGPAGSGKTRLALEFASTRGRSYRDGVWMVDLVRVGDPALVPQAVAARLGIQERRDQTLPETLVRSLAGKRALLVLDNCEHVAAACAELVGLLLEGTPWLRVLATSREVLQVRGESVFPLTQLSFPAPGPVPGPAVLLRYDAVRLLVDRARLSRPDFELTPASGPAVAAICQRLDGMPLAIELAARLVRLMPVDEILSRLSHRFLLLTMGERDSDSRHRSLRTAIDWSYELLSERERAVLPGLSVFRGGFTVGSAAAVCGVDEGAILGVLAGLEAKSLLVTGPAGQAGPARFRQLESIRLYGLERLEECGELEAAHLRLVDWLASFVESLWEGGRPSAAALEAFLQELDNIAQAVEWAGRTGDDREALLAARLCWAWGRQGYTSEARRLLSRVLARPGMRDAYRARALGTAAECAAREGDYGETLRLAEDALAIERAGDRPADLAFALNVMGLAQTVHGEFEAAQELYREAVELSQAQDRPGDLVLYLNNMAWSASEAGAGEVSEATLEELRRLLEGARASGVFSGLGASETLVHTLGELALGRGDLAEAESLFRECLVPAVPDWVAMKALACLGVVAACRSQPERALRLLGAVETLASAINIQPFPGLQARLEAAATGARRQLSARQAEAALAAGRAMDRSRAVDYALEVRRADGDRDTAHPLSRREREVVGLVARGLTNRAIAARLRISERTVEDHLAHARNKLGLDSRVQVATWVAKEAGVETD
jgi:predicted ATPase/DNA-binding CsgD family transcriptional regulator